MAGEFLLWGHRIFNRRFEGGTLMFECQLDFGNVPAGDLPTGITITVPGGAERKIEGPVLLDHKGGALGFRIPVTLDGASAGIYYMRIRIADKEFGDFPFAVDEQMPTD